jgi:hypothetical protein
LNSESPPRMQMLSHIRGAVFVFAAAVLLTLASACAGAWSNGGYSADPEDPDYGTHDWIADAALDMQSRDVSFLETTYHTTYLLATEAPDNPEYIGDSVEHHVYYYASGSLQDDSSAVRASEMYDLALERLDAGDFSVAAYYIGAMTHYIADMGVFGHTMGAYTDWGAEVHHSDYEEEFESMLGSLPAPPGTGLGNMTAYDAAAGLARDITFGSGDIEPNVWMDDNYDWSDDVFVDSAMASLHASVYAVAAAVNHLLFEWTYEAPDDDGNDDDDDDDDDDDGGEEATAPGAPRSLEAYVEDGHVALTWEPPLSDGGEPIIEYWVYRTDATGSRVVASKVSSLTLSWMDEDVQDGGNFTYHVAARNSVGLGDLSEPAMVTISSAQDGSNPWLVAAASALIAALVSAGAIAVRVSRRRRVG